MTAEASENEALTLLTSESDRQTTVAIAELARSRDVAMAQAQWSYDTAIAAASCDQTVALADATFAREAGNSAGGDALDQSQYRTQVALDSAEYAHLTAQALDRYGAEVAVARYAELIQAIDTNREFETLNGVHAGGGAIQGPGPTVVGGMLYLNSGYGDHLGRPGNVLLAFEVVP